MIEANVSEKRTVSIFMAVVQIYGILIQNTASEYHDLYFVIMPSNTVLHRYKTWSLTLRKEHALRVFENRAVTT
jgi:hypothetical protein